MVNFGDEYSYTGSKPCTVSEDFPPVIKCIVDRINTQFNSPITPRRKDGKPGRPIPGPEVTQCLVNRYSGSRAFLPEHSDNEPSLDPESSIFTLSLGDECDIVFKEKSNGSETIHHCNSGSLYYMSRRSQEFYSHRIDTVDFSNKVRFSLTFRRSNSCYKNSLLVMGDSNTRYLHFGEGEHTFGHMLPGAKKWAPEVKDLDPVSCCAYSNVVIMCGINSIRPRKDCPPGSVPEVYALYKSKIQQIRLLNPKINIFVCPILPTKMYSLNRKAAWFNGLIVSDLLESRFGVLWVAGVRDFLDSAGYLSDKLSYRGDPLHLNFSGAGMLAMLIKRCISFRKGNGLISGVSYQAAVAAGGPT